MISARFWAMGPWPYNSKGDNHSRTTSDGTRLERTPQRSACDGSRGCRQDYRADADMLRQSAEQKPPSAIAGHGNAKDNGLGRADTSVPLARGCPGHRGLCNLATQLDGLARVRSAMRYSPSWSSACSGDFLAGRPRGSHVSSPRRKGLPAISRSCSDESPTVRLATIRPAAGW